MENNQQRKLIQNIMPVKGEASPFFHCLASLLFSEQNKKLKLDSKLAAKKLGDLYSSTLTASGLAFSYIFNTDYDSCFDKTKYYKAFGNDDYIKYSLNYGKANYHIVEEDDGIKYKEIVDSIDKDIPVLAEEFADSSWCLITGYDNDKFYGYTSSCPYCQDCINCVKTEINGRTENGLFYISSDRLPKRIIVIDDYNAESYDRKAVVKHWISVMEHKPQNGFHFGNDAYEYVINLLQNDDDFFNMNDNKLCNLYRQIYINSFVPEYRFCSWWLWDTLNLSIKAEKNDSGSYTELSEKLQKIKSNSSSSHKDGWKFWAVLSDKKEWRVNTEKYAVLLKDTKIRKSAVKELRKLQKWDADTLEILKAVLDII